MLRAGTATLAHPDLAAYEHSTRLAFPVVVKELREVLGGRLVACLARVGEVRAVNEWAEGTRTPRGQAENRLRFALPMASFTAEHDGAGWPRPHSRAWTLQLEDRSPDRLSREGDLDEGRAPGSGRGAGLRGRRASCDLEEATRGVHRVGRRPDSWAYPDWASADEDGTFGNRFDDPQTS